MRALGLAPAAAAGGEPPLLSGIKCAFNLEAPLADVAAAMRRSLGAACPSLPAYAGEGYVRLSFGSPMDAAAAKAKMDGNPFFTRITFCAGAPLTSASLTIQ